MQEKKEKLDTNISYINTGAEVTLYYPIKVNNQEITKIFMKRPTVGDLKTIDSNTNNKMEEDIKIFSRLCTPKLSHLDFEELDAIDYQLLGEVFQNFFKKPQAITKS